MGGFLVYNAVYLAENMSQGMAARISMAQSEIRFVLPSKRYESNNVIDFDYLDHLGVGRCLAAPS
jgi:hypothetical protein